MEISLSKNSDVPLRQQLAEQIVFLITTGQLHAGQHLPSVRALARRAKVHHNTVSEAYQDLVRRKWLTRRRGSRLIVGTPPDSKTQVPSTLDELINDCIQRAREMGYSLQLLTERVRERLLAEPPDHILIVEQEAGLRQVIRREVAETLHCAVEACTPAEFATDRSFAIGAQVFAPHFAIAELSSLIPADRPGIPIVYSGADQHVDLIRKLKNPSIIAAVSVSESMLKTARSVFAPAVGRKHSFRAIHATEKRRVDLRAVDLVFCDSVTLDSVSCRRKIQYRLLDPACMDHLASALASPTRT